MEKLALEPHPEHQEVLQELDQGGMLYVFVRVGVETTLERNQITSDHVGHLFHQLLQAGILSTSQFFKGVLLLLLMLLLMLLLLLLLLPANRFFKLL
ncbi:eukaryotic translation initiation factor 4 gamma 3 isoform X7 [Silurus asotus]|uniref:Eukaryotic translation initiation factor 4 gamma 3 isoform X7 n=1 Tax=Silurus asotus TaxID=30991 RepID=A0AAD5A8Q8_SILAS|nr:eukaryotic translation initiation factor 4 gamma 3 isoform X7 [Silurus asotus]